MGNSLSKEERERLGEEIMRLQHFELPKLNVDDKNGITGYIDYIQPNDITGNAMNGRDFCGRFFLSFKATAFFDDGSKEKYFTTFFQRYQDNERTYHSAGHFEKLLFTTEGGAKIEQVVFLNMLFKNGEVFGEDIVRLNGQILESDLFQSEDQRKITPKPTSVKLGWS